MFHGTVLHYNLEVQRMEGTPSSLPPNGLVGNVSLSPSPTPRAQCQYNYTSQTHSKFP